MKKLLAWVIGLAVVILVGVYLLFSQSPSSPTAAVNDGGNGSANSGGNATPGSTTSSGADNSNASTTSMPGMTMGQYKDGTYTGPVANAIYGNLQVAVTVSGGMITNVTYPAYPNSPGHTTEVSGFALPALAQEAIAAQSANVAIISGATQDSQAFQQSLAAALAQAKS